MNLLGSVWIMMIGSFIIQYFIMSAIMTNAPTNIRATTGKFYISIIMALLMGILEVGMHDFYMGSFSTIFYLALSFVLIIFVHLYRNQVYIQDKDYLNEMIEHHSMAILTSEEILQKTSSERVKRLAENIIATQQKEIDYMQKMAVIS